MILLKNDEIIDFWT